MATKQINVERFSVISRKSFQDILAALNAAVGHPDMNVFRESIGAATTLSELERVIQPGVGPSGFMEFIRFDHGEVVHKGEAGAAPRIVRLLIGNPLIMRQMVEQLPDAGSYAPVTILVDERPDGVHLSYDRVASFLAPYENTEVSKVALELDAKVETLLASAAG